MGIDNLTRKRLYTSSNTKWEIAYDTKWELKTTLGSKVVSNGLILPLKKDKKVQTTNGIFEGGVCTASLQFIGGLERKFSKKNANWSCYKGYQISQEELIYDDETVIFGGVLIPVFGHVIADSLTRLWWVVENNTDYKIVFVTPPDKNDLKFKSLLEEIFSLLDIDPQRLVIIRSTDRPVMFKEIIVPDEAGHSLEASHSKWLVPYVKMSDNVLKKTFPFYGEKIYLTRTAFMKRGVGDGVNEQYYENFYKKRGFSIISLEKHPFAEQISILAKAKEVVCTIGTLSHMVLFSHQGIKVTILFRDPNALVLPQFIINHLKQVDWYFVEAAKLFLPGVHTAGVFYYTPTTYFKEYLNDTNTSYDKSEVEEQIKGEDILDYLEKWAAIFSDPNMHKRIKNKTMFDIVYLLNKSLYNKTLDKDKFEAPDEMSKVGLGKDNERLKRELTRIKNSRSWRLTAPLRNFKKIISKLWRN